MLHGNTSKCKAGLLIVLGVLFLLGTLGVWPMFTFAKFWPVFLILFGLHDIACKCGSKACGCGDGK